MPPNLGLEERPETEEAARAVISDIRHDRGHLDDNDELELSKTSVEWQEDYRNREERRRQVYARYTKTVALGAYNSKFRFIHEMLQNADDADYSSIATPTLTFRIRPTELVVESNEFGFTRANVEAICSTGESSKLDDVNTTGEKGLGFKSVFGIANKVHVQSGLWSFRFEHDQGEDGLGMITPKWTEPLSGALPTNIGTRFRLTYAKQNDEFVKRVEEEFEKVPETTIFALKQLKKLEVFFERVPDRSRSLSFEKSSTTNESGESLSIITRRTGFTLMASLSETKVRVVRRVIRDMPSNDLREGSESEVVLGFQVSPINGTPIVSVPGQNIFATLPVQCLPQVPFLIQADFILVPNRESICDHEWNCDLRDGIADAVMQAVVSFCRPGDPLIYKWLGFLPAPVNQDFWEGFHADVNTRLATCRVVESRTRRWQKAPFSLRSLPSRFLCEGQPLVPDFWEDDLYISERYGSENIKKLTILGLNEISPEECLARIQAHTEREDSQLRQLEFGDCWHTAFLTFIDHLIDEDLWRDVQKLKIIPLTTGDWVSVADAETNPVYLPYAISEDNLQVEIPEKIGIQKLRPEACLIPDRRTVYARLGVSDCSTERVLSKITQVQRGEPSGLIRDFVRHFEILFWFGRNPLFLKAIDEDTYIRPSQRLFFKAATPYDALDLLGESTHLPSGYGFIHDLYLTSTVRNSVKNGVTWMQWLEKHARVRSYPELMNESKNGLHSLLQLTAREDSSKFIAALHAHWPQAYGTEFSRHSSTIKSILQETEVQCQSGQKKPLLKTILPTPEIMTRSRECGVQDLLPFLVMPDNAFSAGIEPWAFLRPLGVTSEVNLDFCFTMLNCLRDSTLPYDMLRRAVIQVYKTIGEISTLGESERLSSLFTEGKYVLVSSQTRNGYWQPLSECVWGGPSVILTKHILSRQYRTSPEVSRLFVDLLKVRNATYTDILDVLKSHSQSRSNLPSREDFQILYEVLSSMTNSSNQGEVRLEFETNGLIHCNGQWIKPSQAIWNCTVELSNRHPVGEIYPSLRSFFLNRLGVSMMNAKVLLKALVEASGPRQTPDGHHIKNLMMNTGEILAAEPNAEGARDSIQALKRNRYLPIRNGGEWKFALPDEDFFIIDHERYGSAFRDKLDLLDFTYAELTSLHSLFQLLDLDHRYLSLHVKPETNYSTSFVSNELSAHFQQRSYALSCCAIWHQSPAYFNRGSATHSLLIAAKVLQSDDLWTKLIVRTTDSHVEARSDRAVPRIDKDEDGLRIYVPSDPESLYSCYRAELPAEVAVLLQIQDSTAVKEVYRIINDEGRSLDDIMGDEDIPQIVWLEKPSIPTQSDVQLLDLAATSDMALQVSLAPVTNFTSVVGSTAEDSGADAGISVSSVRSEPNTPSSSHSGVLERVIASGAAHSNVAPVIENPFQNLGVLERVAQTNRYRRVLQHVVRQARRSQPRQQGLNSQTDLFSMSAIGDALDEVDLGNISFRQALGLYGNESMTFAETSRLGAAGELFVFEKLRLLNLPNFDAKNWQSTIRHNVNILAEYADLRSWPPPETADLVYEDNSFLFEQYIRQRSFNGDQLPSWPALGGNPSNWLIEVKTTTGPCSTPFFMSKNQYQLMKQHSLNREALQDEALLIARPRTVYVLFRVYNLLSNNIGLAIFVDPWHLRDNVLEFVADPWKVIPPEPRTT